MDVKRMIVRSRYIRSGTLMALRMCQAAGVDPSMVGRFRDRHDEVDATDYERMMRQRYGAMDNPRRFG